MCNEQFPARLNAPARDVCLKKNVSLPYDLFRHILSFKDPIYEYVRRFRALSAEWVEEYTILAPSAEYQMINGCIVSLHWGRPYTVYRWDVHVMVPTRASI